MENIDLKKLLIALVPLFILVYGVYIRLHLLPSYVKSCDPEYPYLINGLNMALFKFGRIGHTDHPGTPFQFFIGIIIRITHLVAGKGSITTDVFSRPEFYLGSVSLALTIIVSLLTFIVGRLSLNKFQLHHAILLQFTPFLHKTLLSLFERINPDRFFVVITLLFIIVLLKFAFDESKNLKLAIYSGIVMGLGLSTKINYLPLLLIPFFMIKTIKHKLVYSSTLLVSFIVFIAPILKKFPEFGRFILGIVSHDGMYGSGNEQVFNTTKLIEHFKQIFYLNWELYLIIGFLLLGILLPLISRKFSKKNFLFFIGYILALILELLMVSKHFKNYYLAPIFSTYALLLFFSIITLEKSANTHKYAKTLTYILLVIFSISPIQKSFAEKNVLISDRKSQKAITDFVNQNLNKNDYWLIRPTWESGPMVENALIYGLAYCGRRELYINELNSINSNVFSLDDGAQEIQQWKCVPARLDSLITSANRINIYDTPSRNIQQMLNVVRAAAIKNSISLNIDTVFSNNKGQIIQITPVY